MTARLGQHGHDPLVQAEASGPVLEAANTGQIPVSAAYELTRKAPEPVQEAINSGEIDVHQGLAVLKDKRLKAEVAEGKKTVQEAVSAAELLKRQYAEHAAEMGTDAALKMSRLLTLIADVDAKDYLEVLLSRHNQENWSSSFASDWREAIRHMQSVAQAADSQAKTITVDALN